MQKAILYIVALLFVVSCGSTSETTKKLEIGDFYQGGIIFYLDESGQHGMVCSKKDISSNMPWYRGSFFDVNARGRGIGSGEMNTTLIIAAIVAKDEKFYNYAAEQCQSLTALDAHGKVKGGWYLPSIDELRLMYENKDAINTRALQLGGEAFKQNTYWSSTEANYLWAWFVDFRNGRRSNTGKIIKMFVRPVRSF